MMSTNFVSVQKELHKESPHNVDGGGDKYGRNVYESKGMS